MRTHSDGESSSMKKSLAIGATLLLAPFMAGCAGQDDPFTQPRPLYDDSPFEYPVDLWDAGAEGEAMLMVRVSERGRVDSVFVDSTSGHAGLDSAALIGAREMRFEPARRGAEAVQAWVRLPVRFDKAAGPGAAAVGAGADGARAPR